MIIAEIIRQNGDNTLSFGNYQTKDKLKLENFEFKGDIYKVKTHDLVTKLEKNGSLFIEAVPGATFDRFASSDDMVAFNASAKGDVSITLELEADVMYRVKVNNNVIGTMKSSSTGKFVFSVTLNDDGSAIVIDKRND